MTSHDEYRQTVVRLVDGYLAGTTTREAVWQWANELIVHGEFDRLPDDLKDAIHGIWLLHDKDEDPWVPDRDELKQIRDSMA